MKNKKGEIATLLTLGLVVVGTLITLGTSLFVSNKKTNFASNSMAACPKGESVGGGYYKCTAGCGKLASGTCPNYEHNSKDAGCSYCGTGTAPAGSDITLPECTFKGTLLANTECGSSSNVTSVGCGKTSTGAQTYKCKTEPAAQPAAPASSGVDCGMTVAFASQDCANGIDTTGCKSGTAKCKPLVAAAPAGTVYNCSEHGGGTAYQGVGCYELCSKKGSKYIPNSQGIGTDGNNYCCCGGGLPGVDGYPADDSCWIIKCVGGEATKMQYTDSLSKHSMPLSSCNDNMYSGGGKAAIGDANANAILNSLSCSGTEETFTEPEPEPEVPEEDIIPPGEEADNCIKRIGFKCSSGGYTGSTKTFDYYKSTAKGCESNTVGGSCYGTSSTSCSGEWNAFLKSQCEVVPLGPEPANSTLKCKNGSAARCTFGEGASTTRGPGVCNGITEYVYGCSLPPANSQCSDFKDIYECSGARQNVCSWDGNKCIPRTPMGQTAANNNCERVYCSGGKTGEYFKGKPSTTYLYYKTPGECRDNIGAITNETTIKNAVCKSPAAAIQLDTPLDININTPLSAIPLSTDFNLGTGQTSLIILTNPVATSSKPILNGDLSCGNYGKNNLGINNYMPNMTGINILAGEIPTQCIPVIESVINAGALQ